MNESLYEELIQGEGILVLERLDPRRFRVTGVPPSWAALLAVGGVKAGDVVDPAEVFAFLELFLREAKKVWESAEALSLTSDAWSETLANREELAFTATARKAGGRMLLMVRGLGVDYDERCKVLRKARELALAHERLLKETSEKETLLHCLVHDIAGPMMTVANCFQLLESEGSLSESGRGLVRLGGSATHRQQSTLREMLDLFAAELRALEQFSSDTATAPELLDCAHAVLKSLRHSFEMKGVTFELLLAPPEAANWKVVGQREKLERILYNLLDNALRQAPAATAVTLRIEDEGPSIRVSVVDQGSGAEPGVVSRLFGRFQQGTPAPGKTGLGLYFCRTMIKHWSGEIGYEPRSSSGTCFWFRLAKPVPAATP
ncbi:MAG: HAMP domain-containing histidine kinase [Verrucomicrobiales bacterium]|nr:HAMP domain-containing histidine kinase [Verrucomicrobiales bacterium]